MGRSSVLSLLCRLGLRDAVLLFPGKPETAQIEGGNAEHMEENVLLQRLLSYVFASSYNGIIV